MNNTQPNQVQQHPRFDTLMLIADMLKRLQRPNTVVALPLFVASDKQTFQGTLPLHLQHLCGFTYELYAELLERHKNEKKDFHSVGIKQKTKTWFKQGVHEFSALTTTLFSSIACHFPACLDENCAVVITRDWKVVTEEQDAEHFSLELLGMKLDEITNIMELVNQYKVISTETEPEKPNDRFEQDMM